MEKDNLIEFNKPASETVGDLLGRYGRDDSNEDTPRYCKATRFGTPIGRRP